MRLIIVAWKEKERSYILAVFPLLLQLRSRHGLVFLDSFYFVRLSLLLQECIIDLQRSGAMISHSLTKYPKAWKEGLSQEGATGGAVAYSLNPSF